MGVVVIEETFDVPDKSLVAVREPLRMVFWVMMPNQRSTWLSQEAQVGVGVVAARRRDPPH